MTVYILFSDNGWGPEVVGVYATKDMAEEEQSLIEDRSPSILLHIEEWVVST